MKSLNIPNVLILKIFNLAFYDIIDITSESNNDFIRSLSNDVMCKMRWLKLLLIPVINNVNRIKQYIISFIKILNILLLYSKIPKLISYNIDEKFSWICQWKLCKNMK
jgi:uncharacterized membrane protein YesL